MICTCDWPTDEECPQHPKGDSLPQGWYLLQCDTCLASLCWDKNDIQGYDMTSWQEALYWAISEVDHNLFEHEIRRRL